MKSVTLVTTPLLKPGLSWEGKYKYLMTNKPVKPMLVCLTCLLLISGLVYLVQYFSN